MKAACDHYKDQKLHIHWKQLKYLMPIKRDIKNNSFFTFFIKILLNNGNTDNHWFGKSVTKLVDAESFQKIKYIQEGHDKKNDSSDMEIIEKGTLEKALNVKKKTPDEKNPWKTINEVIDDDYFDE